MLLSGLVAFLLLLTAEAKVGDSANVPFCTETEECLLFEPICESEEYEVRHYDSAKWITTEESAFFMDFATMTAFRRLFKYIKDNNVEMTAPVLMKMETKSKYFWERKSFSMSFLLPSAVTDPPTPADAKVKIVEMPETKVYVKRFGGWMMAASAKQQAKSLSASLDSVGAKYESDYFYAAGYNSPMTMFNRHNEVWFVVQDQPVCPSSEEMD
ncbi:heme-binding protein 2 [Nelusetta ayraudi]|uniref:heme-binding protein 2 n=1 Tax=Nelusetta ayraudi TaxID=303726 RepID=UPI003F6EE56A